MISIFCKQYSDVSEYTIKLTFNESDLLGLLTIDDEEIHYAVMLKTWSGYWVYVSREDYEMLKEVLRNNEK